MMMADEGNERRRTMDLNLYLGLPLSPLPHIPDLGSDLALGSVPSPRPPLPAADMEEDPHMPYTPSPIVVDEEEEEEEDPASPDISSYLPSSSFNLEFTPSPLPFHPIVVFPPYSPSSYGRSPPAANEVGDGASGVPYTPPPSVGIADESMDVDDPLLLRPYDRPRPVVTSTPPQVHGGVEPYQPTPVQAAAVEIASQDGDGGSSSRQEAFRSQEFRFRRLIESDRRVRAREGRRFRSSLPYRDRTVAFGAAGFPTAEQHLHAVLAERPFETSGKNKVNDDGINNDGLGEEKEEKSGSAVNFECNICYDVAKEPVVTSCGHLFCWPCLYQWLHHYSDHKECPACKGQVIEANITPIYGRGSSEDVVEVKAGGNGDPDLKIPPRPRGRRFESLRQQIQRPISRRPGEGVADPFRRSIMGEELFNMGRLEGLMDPRLSVIAGRLEEGVSNPPRHNLDQGMQTGIRSEGHLSPAVQQLLDHGSRVVTRIRGRRLLRTDDREARLNPINVISRVGALAQQAANPGFVPNDGIDSLNRYSLDMAATERLAAIRADLNMLLVTTFARDGSHSLPSTLPADPQNPEAPGLTNSQNPGTLNAQLPVGATQSADQASASSTMAVIQDDAGATDTSAEPSRAGSSRPSRRRGRNNASGAFDVDGVIHTNKRRRLN